MSMPSREIQLTGFLLFMTAGTAVKMSERSALAHSIGIGIINALGNPNSQDEQRVVELLCNQFGQLNTTRLFSSMQQRAGAWGNGSSGGSSSSSSPAASAAAAAAAASSASVANSVSLSAQVDELTRYPFEKFIKNDRLARFEREIDVLRANGSGEAHSYKNVCVLLTQLYGWLFQEYCIKIYLDKGDFPRVKKALSLEDLGGVIKAEPSGFLNQYDKGLTLLKKIIKTVLEHPNESAQQILNRIDHWQAEVEGFWKETEARVSNFIHTHKKEMDAYEKWHAQRGVPFPLGVNLLAEIQSAGFRWNVHVIKMDSCVCDVCGTAVAGWRPWYDPKTLHDPSKHAKK